MHIRSVLFVLIAAFTVVSASGATDVVVRTSSGQPEVRAVLFRADWCANCRVLEPVLAQAVAKATHLPVQHISLDFTNAQTWDHAIELALDHDIVTTYNAYAGTTGLVVLVAADTGERIDCINRLYTVDAMVAAFDKAVKRTRTSPPGSRDVGSVVCPPSRMAP
ncbi:MAG: hypothetical protein COA47_06565 [Robiginitomaculum sp.]|nr:MAG: hypothetical protein COA47_06565 [Robiginitomaculum sp.]